MKQTVFCTLSFMVLSGLSISSTIAPVNAAPQVVAQKSQQCLSSFHLVRTNQGDPLNVREQPNMRARIVGKLPYGTDVIVNLYDRTGEWAEVSAPKGKTSGWVAARYLQKAAVGGELPNGKMRVKTLDGDRLNIRSQPVLNAKVLGTVRNNTTVTFLGYEGNWTKIIAPNGIQGYVASQYLACN